MRWTILAATVTLAGCVATPTTNHSVALAAVPSSDTSVAVTDLELRAAQTLEGYIETSNHIAENHGAGASAMDEWTTPDWAIEERAGFAALSALPETDVPPRITLGRWEVAAERGRTVLVDALVHACLAMDASPVLVSIRLIPRAGSLVIDDVRPWEDSTWCLEPAAS